MAVLEFKLMKEAEREWLKGQATLGAATKWTPEEIRLVTELGFGLAEQGRISEAIVVFEGLTAVAPATAYFQAALGALWLREGDSDKALLYLNQVLQIDGRNVVALVNRGEAFLGKNDKRLALKDFYSALKIASEVGKKYDETSPEGKSLTRAAALINSIENNGFKDY